MQVTFLGTGSAMPAGTRFQTGQLVEHDDMALLLDCGSGVLHSLAGTDVGYEGVDAVLLTHHHLDHISDLMVLLKARWLAGETTITIAGPPGTESLVRDLLDVHDYMADRFEFTFEEIEHGESTTLLDFEIDALETIHSMDCLAYRISAGEQTFVYSGDTEEMPALLEFADGATVLAHDCSFPDDIDVSNHPTPSSLGTTLADVEPHIDRIYLTHLYPHTDGRHEEMLESLGQYYDGDVEFATDGLVVDLTQV